MIVALEVIDACGKQTHAKLLCEEADRRGLIAEILDFPQYGSETGQIIRGILTHNVLVAKVEEEDTPQDGRFTMEPWSYEKAFILQSLMVVDRLVFHKKLLAYKNNDSKLLILDRYNLSGLCYGTADGLSREWLTTMFSALLEPDIYILLDISVEESMRRRPERRDYYEKNEIKLREIRQLFLDEFYSRSWRPLLRLSSKDDPHYVLFDAANLSKMDLHLKLCSVTFNDKI